MFNNGGVRRDFKCTRVHLFVAIEILWNYSPQVSFQYYFNIIPIGVYTTDNTQTMNVPIFRKQSLTELKSNFRCATNCDDVFFFILISAAEPGCSWLRLHSDMCMNVVCSMYVVCVCSVYENKRTSSSRIYFAYLTTHTLDARMIYYIVGIVGLGMR